MQLQGDTIIGSPGEEEAAATTASISSILAAPVIEIGSRRSNHHSQGIGLRVL